MSDLCRCADEVRCAMRAELERLTAELKNEIQCKNNLAEMSKSLTAENAELKDFIESLMVDYLNPDADTSQVMDALEGLFEQWDSHKQQIRNL